MDGQDSFGQLPSGMRIPASPTRVVALQRSRNLAAVAVGDRSRNAMAYLATLYLLRGTYALYAWLQFDDQSGGLLAGGREVAVTEHSGAELEALEWLSQRGFDMAPVSLNGLELADRIAALAALPFAHRSDFDATAIPGAAPPMEDHLAEILADVTPRDAVRRLRALLLTS